MATQVPEQKKGGSDELDMTKVIGSKISLITTSNIRYEGILISIESKTKVLTLKNVRSFGTEGRNNGTNEIAPAESENSYEFIKFKVELIRSLNILSKPTLNSIDPAIVGVEVSADPKKDEGAKGEEDEKERPSQTEKVYKKK